MPSLTERYESYLSRLAEYGQSHLLQFWDELSSPQRGELLDDLDAVDFDRCAPLIDPLVRNEPDIELPQDIQPPPILPAAADAKRADMYAKAARQGTEAIRAGKVAAFVVAGGQGTRLGFDGPKGAFPISPIRKATLFQLFAEQLLGVERAYGHRPPWYVMTSPQNHAETVSFFEQHGYFGLDRGDIMFFNQGQMPAFHPDGRMVLAEKHRVALSPDGHGGSLRALAVSGALKDMEQRGVEHLSYFQVDNPLVKIFDPLFIGLHIAQDSELSSKAIPKAHDKERVGNFCLADGKLVVIEYSDLPETLATARVNDGQRKFDAGSIAIHLFARSFIERLTADPNALSLPWHRAIKKVPFVDDQGRPIEPEEPNAIKLETFVFDALPLARYPLIIYTRREEEFSPVKNAEGTDSAVSCRRDLIARAARWLETCDATVPREENGTPAQPIEVSPAYALDAADLRRRLTEPPTIKRGEPLLLTD